MLFLKRHADWQQRDEGQWWSQLSQDCPVCFLSSLHRGKVKAVVCLSNLWFKCVSSVHYRMKAHWWMWLGLHQMQQPWCYSCICKAAIWAELKTWRMCSKNQDHWMRMWGEVFGFMARIWEVWEEAQTLGSWFLVLGHFEVLITGSYV